MMKNFFKSLPIFALFSYPTFASTVIDIDTFPKEKAPSIKAQGIRIVSFDTDRQALMEVKYYSFPEEGAEPLSYTVNFKYGGAGIASHSTSFEWHPTKGITLEKGFIGHEGCSYRVRTKTALPEECIWKCKDLEEDYRFIHRDGDVAGCLSLKDYEEQLGAAPAAPAAAASESDPSLAPADDAPPAASTLSEVKVDLDGNKAERGAIGELATRLTFLKLKGYKYWDTKINENQGFDGAYVGEGEVVLSESKCHKSTSQKGSQMGLARNLGVDVVAVRLRNLRDAKHPFFSEFLTKLTKKDWNFRGVYHFVQSRGKAEFSSWTYNTSELMSRVFPLIVGPAIEVAKAAEEEEEEEQAKKELKVGTGASSAAAASAAEQLKAFVGALGILGIKTKAYYPAYNEEEGYSNASYPGYHFGPGQLETRSDEKIKFLKEWCKSHSDLMSKLKASGVLSHFMQE